jgi:hypothetical protein
MIKIIRFAGQKGLKTASFVSGKSLSLTIFKMKNSDISFQEGQIVFVQNKVAEVKEVREKTLILEIANCTELTELSKGKVDVVTFGTEFF